MTHEDPRIWWIMMLKAIVGLQRRSTAPAWSYYEFVKGQRGEAAAERCRKELKRYAASERFKDADKLLAKALLDGDDPTTGPSFQSDFHPTASTAPQGKLL